MFFFRYPASESDYLVVIKNSAYLVENSEFYENIYDSMIINGYTLKALLFYFDLYDIENDEIRYFSILISILIYFILKIVLRIIICCVYNFKIRIYPCFKII